MRRGRLLILFAFILLFGALAVFFLMRILNPTDDSAGIPSTGQAQPTGQIVFAAQDIPRGSIIQEGAVILSPFPSDNIIDTMINDTALVIGQYARMDIARGIPVTLTMVTQISGDLLGTGSDAAVAIPPGQTAISIPMDRLSGVAYALRPGDKVDVIVAMDVVDQDTEFQTILPNMTYVLVSAGPPGEANALTASANFDQAIAGRVESEPVTGELLYVFPSENQYPRLVTQRLLSYATVLHIGTFPLEAEEVQADELVQGVGAPAPDTTGEAPVIAPPPDIITLIVSPQDALALHWALESGSELLLTLRAPNDLTETATTSVTLQYLLDNYNITIPTKLPFRLQPMPGTPIQQVLP